MGIKLSQAEIERRLREEYGLRQLEITGEKARILKDTGKKKLRRAEAIKEIAKRLSRHGDPRTRAEVMRVVFNLKPSIRRKIEKASFEFKKEKDPKLVEKEIKTKIALGKVAAGLAEKLKGSREAPEVSKEEIISEVLGGEKTSEEIGVKRQTGIVSAADDYPGKTPSVSAGPGLGSSAGGVSPKGRPGIASLGNRAADNYPDRRRSSGLRESTPRVKDPLSGSNIKKPGLDSGMPSSRLSGNNPFIGKARNP